jgi:histidine triad (HIT) family protein
MAERDLYCDDVLSGRTPVRKVKETDLVLAFHHPNPYYSPVHLVVIPKEHVRTIVDASDEVLLEVFKIARDLAKQVSDERGAAKIVTNLGDYQHNKHLHVHVAFGEQRS